MHNQYLTALILLLIACLLLPFAALPGDSGLVAPQATKSPAPDADEKFKIYLEQADKTVTLSAEDYLLGVLCAEISPDTHPEAIKAQAVASYTYARYRQAHSDEQYDLTDAPSSGQGYLTEKAARAKLGAEYDAAVAAFGDAIDAVAGELLTRDGAPILAAYHAVSAGKTETGENAFGAEYPYLVAVESVGDLLSPDYFSTKSVEPVEFFEKLADSGVEDAGEDAYPDLIGEVTRSDSGTVMEILIGEVTFSGADLRELFDLRSANFDLAYDGEGFVFTTRGWGHGAGLSQYGANYMASLGSSYTEILAWYYPECEVGASCSPEGIRNRE